MFKDFLLDGARKMGIDITPKQIENFTIYYEELIKWNEKINLTAITEPKEVAIKHILDSLTAYDEKYFKENTRLIDVGTGAGFPSVVLKIFREDINLTLLDALNKRIVFLKELLEKLGLQNVNFLHARSEEAGKNKEHREQYDLATARAVANLPVLNEYCLPFVKKGGYFVALKGRKYKEELDNSANSLKLLGGNIKEIKEITLPYEEDLRGILYIEKIKNTPKTYPRKAGMIKKNPL